MATPIEWLNEFQVNTGTAFIGDQFDPQIIGLSNGNILAVWQEQANGSIGTDPGSDLIGKVYGLDGTLVRNSFQINSFRFSDDESDFDIAATNDGGFVIVYVDDDISNPAEHSIIWERYGENGVTRLDQGSAAFEANTDDLDNPQVAVNLSDNSFIIAYEDVSGGEENISARVVNGSGVLSTEFGAAQNSINNYDRLGDTALLSNGNYVVVYNEQDGSNNSLEFVIRTPTGGVVGGGLSGAVGIAPDGNDPQVAALAGGGFVVVYEVGTPGDRDILARIFNNDGTAVGGVINVAVTSNDLNEPEVVALPDGGFVVVFDDDTTFNNTLARSYNADGSTDGSTFVVSDTTEPYSPNISVTGDGRILFTWQLLGTNNEIFASIWDPRSNVLDPDDYDVALPHVLNSQVITTGTGDTTVLAGDTFGDYTVLGQGGNDTIFSSGNGDYRGGAGNDTITAGGTSGTEFERLDGGTGIDTLITTTFNGDYTVNLVTGATDYAGNPVGGNELFVNFENITMGNGDDTVTGTAGANIIRTGGGNDTVNASFGADTIFLGDGNDTATSSGLDTIFGEGGNDTIIAGLGLPETLDGGTGVDSLITNLFSGDYIVNLATGLTNFAGELFTNFENLRTGDGNDELFGTVGANLMSGGSGNDRILGFAGNDTLNGELGNDRLNGGEGNDTINGNAGDDVVFAGDGDDLVNGGDGADELNGDLGNDTLNGGAGNDILRGRQGNDVMQGDDGDDTMFGGDGNDTLRGGDGNDLVNGGGGGDILDGEGGNDTVVGGSEADRLFGGEGNDTLRGEGSNDVLEGEGGDDLMFGSSGDDTLFGGDGNDTMEGNAQADDLFGETGNDILRGGDGFDFLDGGSGNDVLAGGNGNDILVGGIGVDILRGNAQNDTFRFNSRFESFLGSEDVIEGIEGIGVAGGDIIDLAGIDADINTAGNQAFTFLGAVSSAVAFGFGAGALWVEDFGNQTRLHGDIDSDGIIEVSIKINDGAGVVAADYSAGDFIL